MPKVIKDVCDAYDCLIRTCSKHKIQYSRRNRFELNWVSLRDGCKMFKSKDQWKTFFTPPPKDYIEDEDE